MSAAEQAATQLQQLADLAQRVAREMSGEISQLATLVTETLQSGNKLLFCGNGGSAADAQHLATEYVVRFSRKRAPVAALALTTDTSLLTAAANDYGFQHVFARQVAALGRPGDLLFLHSTSGESENLLSAAQAARIASVRTVALLARGGGRLRGLVDHALVVPTENGARAQELQLAIGHLICDLVEAGLPYRTLIVDDRVIGALQDARRAEKSQTLFYRMLAAAAAEAGDTEGEEDLNGLHADEQHHLSRITVTLVEANAAANDLNDIAAPAAVYPDWQNHARAREEAEIARYEALLTMQLDENTAALVREMLAVERKHAERLGGKYMSA